MDDTALSSYWKGIVTQATKNVNSDSPSKDDVAIIYADKLIALSKQELKKAGERLRKCSYDLDIAQSRLAFVNKDKYLGEIDEREF